MSRSADQCTAISGKTASLLSSAEGCPAQQINALLKISARQFELGCYADGFPTQQNNTPFPAMEGVIGQRNADGFPTQQNNTLCRSLRSDEIVCISPCIRSNPLSTLDRTLRTRMSNSLTVLISISSKLPITSAMSCNAL